MTPNPQHGTPAGDAVLAIQKLARTTGADVQELQTLYALEAFLARVASSTHRDEFVLKGGVLLAAFEVRRPTKDVDLQATGISNDAHEVSSRIRTIATIDLPDGVVFDPEAITASVIRDSDDGDYPGVRVRLVAMLGRARLTIGVDVNFGDPIWPVPQPVDLPRLVDLGQPRVILLGYPLTMVLAEKIATAIDRGEANTRWRDFADVYALSRVHGVDAQQLRTSIETVAGHRGVQLAPLVPTLSGMPERVQSKWRAWRTRAHRDHDLPEHFADVLDALALFTDPVLIGVASGHWDPTTKVWRLDGP